MLVAVIPTSCLFNHGSQHGLTQMSDEGERNEQKLPRNSSTPYQMLGNTRSPNYSNYSNFFL